MYIVSHRGFMVVVFLSCKSSRFFLGIVIRMISFRHPLVPLVFRVLLQSLCFCQPSARWLFSSYFCNSSQTFLPCVSHTENLRVCSYRRQSLLLKVVVFCFLLPMLCPVLLFHHMLRLLLLCQYHHFTLDSNFNPFSSRPHIYYLIFLVFF